MSEPNSFEGLKLLHADLLAVSESRLLDLERLLAQLHAHTEEFRGLLDKNARNEQSRQALATGRLEIGDTVYGVNEEFQQGALQLADELNLDELVAAEIFFDATDDGASFGRTALESGIIKFHQQRQYLLDCLRMILEQSANVDQEERIRVPLQNVIVYILQPPGEAANSPDNSSKFLRKCYSSMEDIRSWLQKLADKLNSASVLGQGQRQEVLETIEFQRRSLVQQHESLGVIVLYLVKTSRGNVSDFEVMVEVVRKMDRYDNLLVHYFPTLGAFISRFGAPEGGGSLEVARALNAKLFGQTDSNPWALQYVYAAFKAWWLAEYSGWYNETYGEHAVAGVNLEEESKQRSKQFTEALKDGAFDFLMSLSADAKAAEWNDPARHGLRDWLQHKAPQLVSDSIYFSDFFQDVLMEQLESFIDGFITNLPDVLRRLRIDEDEQRQLNQRHEHDVDLERFLVIISYAFEGRPKAAMEAFWGVQDGALLGFIHWASRRASTPLVSAFCEMLQALSEDEDCATAAHEFLLDDAGHTSGMMRRSQSLTWSQIFRELTFFSEKIRDRPAIPQSQSYRAGNPNNDQVETEPESAMMLECYLRLIARLSAESELARQYLLQHPTFRLVEMLLQFASSDILPRLRACAFTALSRLLSHKNRPTGEHIWASLDHWISGGYAPGSHLSKSSPPSETRKSSAASNRIFEEIGRGFEQPNAFIQLLIALVSPYEDEESINDSLSFPENLGSATRMPGIDPYIDFAVGHIFGGHLADRLDTVEQRLLQLTCLEFISACLTTFNEDLVIFANQSNVQVDAAINTSNLAAYVCLHPFSRVMEWVFSDAVMSALFSAIHQNISDVATARPSSPILLCLLSSIRVVTLIMDLQYTYLDIIRPLIKLQPTHRRHHVSNAAFASFEDGVLNNLSVIADLGLYCGLGHPELTIASLGLLERLSASPKLASTSTAGMGRRVDRNKVIAALETNNDAESISRSLVREMDEMFDPEQGSDSSTYKIKIHILDFLLACLRVSPGRPTIAHLLLGFQCKVDYLDIDPEGPFSQGSSLFHSILKLALTLEDPEALDGSSDIFLLLASLKTKALLILKQLWTSPLSANLTMEVLQANNAPFWLFNQEAAIEPKALCDGLEVADPRFLMSPAASCLSELLSRRSIVFQYISAELRSLVRSNSTSLKNRVVETLLGSTTQADGTRTQNASVFELFDFMEFDLSYVGQLSDMTWFGDINFAVCLEDPNDPESVYNLTKVEELLILRQAELVKANRLTNPQDTVQLQVQAQTLMQFLASHNQKTNLRVRKLDVLRSWVQLMVVVTNTWGSDDSTKISFVLQALQTVMPRLENSLENAPEAMELAQLAKALLFSLEFGSESFKNSDLGDMASDRLLHLFQLSLKAIGSPLSNASLKETFYGICYRYLTGMSDAAGILGLSRRHSTQTIKAAGERLIDIICDDAYAGDRTCRIAALLLLACLVKLGNKEGSKYVIESLERLNFISILVDSLRNITKELRGTPREDVSIQLSYCNARLALLLQLSQTRHGATVVLKSGLFHAVEASGLFKADPDLGVDIDDADAVSKHYDLLAAIVRVLCAAVLSRGRENQQTIDQARKFISENRTSILAVFKRSAGLSTGGKVAEKSIEDLTESFMLLISATEFLDFDEKAILKPLPKKSFT